VVLAAVAASARAQVGVYINPVFTKISNNVPDTGPFAFLGEGSTSRNFGGVDFGAYYNITHGAGAKFGVDVRDTTVHSNNAALNIFSIAARVESAPLTTHGIRPYAEIAAGAATSKAAQAQIHATRGMFAIFGGIDYPLTRIIDFRVVEVGYGGVTVQNSFIYGGPNPIGSSRMIQVSSGLVFRFGTPGGAKKQKRSY
jgi:hypothetical protein